MSNANANETTNVVLKNVELWWVKCDPKNPVSPFGTAQWEVQVRFPKKRVAEMEQYGTVKEVPSEKGVYQLNLKKKAEKKDGSPAMAVEFVGTKKDEVINPKTVGNGSIGNVKLMLRDYQIKGPKGNITKEGTQVMLSKVQVTEYIKYEPKNTDDFDFDDAEDETEEHEEERQPAPAKAKGKPGRKPALPVDDDEIPF